MHENPSRQVPELDKIQNIDDFREKLVTLADDNTREFLLACYENGTFRAPFKGRPDVGGNWNHRVNELLRYMTDPELTVDQVQTGPENPKTTKQNKNKFLLTTLGFLYRMSDAETKSRFELKFSTQKYASRAILARIQKATEDGRALDEILKEEGMTPEYYTGLITRARARGDENIPLAHSFQRVAALVNAIEKDIQNGNITQAVTNAEKLTEPVIKRLLMEDASPLVPMKTILEGYHYAASGKVESELMQELRESGVVAVRYSNRRDGKQPYYYVAKSQLEKAKAILADNPYMEMYRNHPVEQVSGDTEVLPSTAQLVQKKGYKTAGECLRDLGIRIMGRNLNVRVSDFIGEDCPVAVYKYGNSYYVSESDAEAFSKYAKKRYQEFRENR